MPAMTVFRLAVKSCKIMRERWLKHRRRGRSTFEKTLDQSAS